LRGNVFSISILRAKDGVRTRDLDLGKVALYQLSYFRVLLIRSGDLVMQRYTGIFICQGLALKKILFFSSCLIFRTIFLIWDPVMEK
jgi:hypothetical protein